MTAGWRDVESAVPYGVYEYNIVYRRGGFHIRPFDIKKGDQRSPLTNNILISSKTALTIVLGNPIVIKIETDYIYPRGRVNLQHGREEFAEGLYLFCR